MFLERNQVDKVRGYALKSMEQVGKEHTFSGDLKKVACYVSINHHLSYKLLDKNDIPTLPMSTQANLPSTSAPSLTAALPRSFHYFRRR